MSESDLVALLEAAIYRHTILDHAECAESAADIAADPDFASLFTGPTLLADNERLTAENARLRRTGHCDRERHIDPVHVACAECQGWDLQGLPRAHNHARTCSRYDDHGEADYRARVAAEARLTQVTEGVRAILNGRYTIQPVVGDQLLDLLDSAAASVVSETGEAQ